MSDVNVAPEAASPSPASNETITAPEGTPAKISLREAAQALRNARTAKASAEASPPAAEPEPVSAPAEDAAPPQEATGEETQEAPPVEKPTIEPPRSWSKEARERWATLDPDTQNYLLERDREDSTAIRNAQNQAAEERKALEAQRLAAEQVQKQYESALPVLLQNMETQVAGEFTDIKSMDDVEKMARDDWPRFNLWQAHQMKINAIRQELDASVERQNKEKATEWQTYVAKEDALFAESVPEIADPEKGPKLREQAVKYLKDIGYTDTELAEQWNSGYLRNHKVQRAIVDAVKYREAQAQVKSTPPKPVPPVTQRPGVAQGRNAERESLLKNLEQKLDKTGSWKAAAELLMAKRQAARR